MNRDAPAGVASFLEMFDKERRREIRLVARQIERDEMLAMRKQRLEFLHANLRAVRPTQNSDKVHGHVGGRDALSDPGHDAFDHFRHVELMRLRHEIRTEPQLQVIDPFPLRVLDVFPRDAPARVAIYQHPGSPKHFRDERHQARLRFRHLHMRPDLIDRLSRQLDVMLPGQIDYRLQPDAPIEMAVQIDEGKAGID